MSVLDILKDCEAEFREALEDIGVACEVCAFEHAEFGDGSITALCKAYERLGYISGYRMGLIDRQIEDSKEGK